MKTTPFTTSAGEFLAVDLPSGKKLSISYTVPNTINIWHEDKNNEAVELPEGNWQIICKQSEVTEDIAKWVVDKSIHTGLFGHYVKNIPLNTYCYKTALESFKSRTDSLELYSQEKVSERLILKKVEE